MCQRVQHYLSKKYKTVGEAEDDLGCSVEMYMEGTSEDLQDKQPLHPPPDVMNCVKHLQQLQLSKIFHSLLSENKVSDKLHSNGTGNCKV